MGDYNDTSDPSDKTSLVSGSPRAAVVEQLFREHNLSLVRFLSARLHSEQEARDVAQEAYVRLLRMESPEAVSYLRAFLFKTAANIAIDRLRSRRSEARALEAELHAQHTGVPSLERSVAAAEELQMLAAYVDELPPRCRQVFLLRRLHDLSAAEISCRLDIPERTVRHYVVEAIVYCRRRMDGVNHHREGAPVRSPGRKRQT